MPLPITIPNTFANATATIPLSQLDNNFSTVAVAVNSIGNGAFTLANAQITGGTISNVTLDNVSVDVETLSNVTITNLTVNGNATLTNATVTANVATITTANVTTANTTTLVVTGNTTLGNASTDTVAVNGYMGVGGAATSDRAINILGTNSSSNVVQEGIRSAMVASSSATTAVRAFVSVPNTQAAAFTVSDVSGFLPQMGLKAQAAPSPTCTASTLPTKPKAPTTTASPR